MTVYLVVVTCVHTLLFFASFDGKTKTYFKVGTGLIAGFGWWYSIQALTT